MAEFNVPKSLKDFQSEQIQTLLGNRRYIFHIIIWLLSALFFYSSSDTDSFIESVRFEYFSFNQNYVFIIKTVSTITGLLLSALVTYTFLFGIVPYAKYKAKRRYIFLYFFVELILVLFVPLLIVTTIKHFTKFDLGYILTILLAVITIQFYFISLYFFLSVYDKQKTFKHYSLLLEKRLLAESKFLSSQINPHFLFNTINNIYALTMRDKEKAVLGLEKLELLIDYIHKKSQQDFILLDDEINFLKSYIDLEYLRYSSKKVDLSFEITGNSSGQLIAPLILITFLENAFKHGVRNNKENPYIHIILNIEDDMLLFTITNPVTEANSQELDEKTGGIGMKNTIRRLELIYPDRHKLKINTKNSTYELTLTISLS